MWQARMAVVLLAIAIAGCGREGEDPARTPPVDPAVATTAVKPEAPELEDVIERDPRYVIGISYPPIARQYPGLARLLEAYARDARAELMVAVSGLGNSKPAAPYELSLAFSEVAATPDLVAIAADGNTYTGGAHANPLLARFVWLPKEQRQLTTSILIPDPARLQALADYLREHLATALSARIDGEELPPAERARMLETGTRMIDAGTSPDPRNFAQFEPVLDGAGRITALRFVFPPYQVGPYSDGMQTVEVPAAVLLPMVAPGYRPLFAGG
ncbi:MAG: DUF3298 domain-containing protein [Lysobacteraceae bacterium]|nr:MAG: DUF3298 domain-containing protein [Xanthomonadaceae bacterium]